MRSFVPFTLGALIVTACGGAPPAASPNDAVQPETPRSEAESAAAETSASEAEKPVTAENEPGSPGDAAPEGNAFTLQDSKTAKQARGAAPSAIRATKTHAAMKFFVVDKEKGPIPGIVIAVTAPDGATFHTPETDAQGYAEVLVPVGQKYDLVYLSLGRQDIASSVTVTDEPRQNIKLTLRYKRFDVEEEGGGFVLDGVQFDTAKATIRSDSYARLNRVAEYLTHKPQTRIEISGHTDNKGNPKTNKALSLQRAQACRDYLIAKGIDGSRIQAVGYGDERPIAPNDSEDGRQKNRRIEAAELTSSTP
jgi:outer membrane protein OmpA-like peptidoglycan-associated protein